MSKESKKFDVSSRDIKALLAKRYGDGMKYVCAAEVGCQTGWANRRIDFMAMCCWESDCYEIEAFEIKISKSDFKRELTDPSKHNVFFDDIDKYWIVAPDFVLDDMSIIPPKWGVCKVIKDDGGSLSLKTARKPMALHDEQTSKRKLDRAFVASMCRAFNEQNVMKCRLMEEHKTFAETVRREIEQELVGKSHVVSDYDFREFNRYREICRRLGVDDWFQGASQDNIDRFKTALQLIKNIERANMELSSAEREIRFVKSQLKGLSSKIGDNGIGFPVDSKECDKNAKES